MKSLEVKIVEGRTRDSGAELQIKQQLETLYRNKK